jgi:hypothetical protein
MCHRDDSADIASSRGADIESKVWADIAPKAGMPREGEERSGRVVPAPARGERAPWLRTPPAVGESGNRSADRPEAY